MAWAHTGNDISLNSGRAWTRTTTSPPLQSCAFTFSTGRAIVPFFWPNRAARVVMETVFASATVSSFFRRAVLSDFFGSMLEFAGSSAGGLQNGSFSSRCSKVWCVPLHWSSWHLNWLLQFLIKCPCKRHLKQALYQHSFFWRSDIDLASV